MRTEAKRTLGRGPHRAIGAPSEGIAGHESEGWVDIPWDGRNPQLLPLSHFVAGNSREIRHRLSKAPGKHADRLLQRGLLV